MKIQDLSYQPIERVEARSTADVRLMMETARKPLIFSGIERDFEFLSKWNLEFLGSLDTVVPVQRPEEDGVNYFIDYFHIPMSEFVARIQGGENLYIGAREIMSRNGAPSQKDGLAELASLLDVPDWFDLQRLWSANLWVGAGDNNTLLHYDPWDSIQILREGEKKFYVLPDTDSPNLYQYGALNYVALYRGKFLHSKIRPLTVQDRYQEKFARCTGFEGTLRAGEVIFLPAGFWHYVESSGQNVGVNFFVHAANKAIHWKEPLRTYWIKDNITAWPVRAIYKAKYYFFQALRAIFPKRGLPG